MLKDKKIDFFGRFFGFDGKDFRVEKSSAKKSVKNCRFFGEKSEKSDIFPKKSDFSQNLG